MASSIARRYAASPASFGCTAWFTMPSAFASSPVNWRAVKMSSLAMAGFRMRGNRWVPPAPGIMPSFVSTRPSFALVATTRISQASAISRPPPSAAPSIAATTGVGICSMLTIIWRSFETKRLTSCGVKVARSFRSAPAQKIPGTRLRRITTRTFLSCARTSIASSSCVTSDLLNELRAFGRFRPSTAIPCLSSSVR
uniref:Putative secreted protein n=1 Tax=Anopheles triannulatus TaxID=58253 RepID=A0A2M4AWW4_9DIPT